MMVRSLLIRGMLAGLIAGVSAFVVARLIGEAPVESAIGLEEHASHGHGGHGGHGSHGSHGEEAELVSRATQGGLGLAVATLVFGVAIGGIFALAFSIAHGRIGPVGPKATVAVLGLAGFVAVYFVPFLKYPANPPAVGNPATIGERTGWYFAVILISACFAVGAFVLRRKLADRLGGWNSTVLATAGFLVLVALTMWLLPAADVSYGHFPAPLLWQFRVASIGIQAVLWATLVAAFAPLAERVLRPASAGQPRAADLQPHA